jgi:hypothetical protein
MIVDGLGHVSLDSQPVQPVAAVNNVQPNIHQGNASCFVRTRKQG